jgi:hypothetical protein
LARLLAAPPEDLPQFSQGTSMSENMGELSATFQFVIRDAPTNVLQKKVFDNIFFDRRQTTEYVAGPQHVVRIDQMLDEFTGEIDDPDPVDWFRRNVMDHCPVYAVFRANVDTD